MEKVESNLPEFNYEIVNLIAAIYNDKMKYQKAIDWTEKLYKINPDMTGVVNNLATLYEYND